MSCAQTRELAPEFALGVLGGAERAEAVAHLHDCASCRQAVAELSETVDVIVQLAPEADPPLGFETLIGARIRGDRRRTVRRWARGIAAVAAAAAIVAVVAVRVVQGTDGRRPVAAVASGSEVRSGAMIGGGGSHVGEAFAYRGKPSWVSVTVAYTVPTGEYQVELVHTDGRVESVGSMRVTDGAGAWGGPVTSSLHSVQAVQMRGTSGAVMCRANLRAA